MFYSVLQVAPNVMRGKEWFFRNIFAVTSVNKKTKLQHFVLQCNYWFRVLRSGFSVSTSISLQCLSMWLSFLSACIYLMLMLTRVSGFSRRSIAGRQAVGFIRMAMTQKVIVLEPGKVIYSIFFFLCFLGIS